MSDTSNFPVAGQDYPRNSAQFQSWFADETVCAQYLEKLRWPTGYVCPACGVNEKPYRASRSRLICHACQAQTSITSGTIFEGTRTPLATWFAAIWYITNQKNGVSALGLQRVLGFGSYQTAWTILHKLRKAMVRPGREKLAGTVEVDETYVGGEEEGVRGRQTETKAIVAIAVELLTPKGYGRIRLCQIDDVSGKSLIPFILDAIEPGATVNTDGWNGYNGLANHGYIHHKTVLSELGDPAHVAMPGVHRIASLLKRWLLGTHQGAVLPNQLNGYLDEYTFRFNRRKSKSRGLLFYRLLQNAVVTGPSTYQEIIKHPK